MHPYLALKNRHVVGVLLDRRRPMPDRPARRHSHVVLSHRMAPAGGERA